MRYHAPDDRTVLTNPGPGQLEEILRTSPFSYWQLGGNGEASLDAGPHEASLWIKQPERGRFFLTFAKPPKDCLVPYDGQPCEPLVEDERGGDSFWIPRAYLVDTDQAVDAVLWFLKCQEPTATFNWLYWHELPLADSYPQP
jgi:hypothetical protein